MASSTTSPSANAPGNELQRALAQQAVVAKLGEQALQNGDPESLMHAATSLIGEIDGVHSACIWELGRDGRRLNLVAGLERGGDRRRPPRLRRDATRTPAPRSSSGTPAIVGDWAERETLHDAAGPARVRRRRAASR